jgi:hypothetical protein
MNHHDIFLKELIADIENTQPQKIRQFKTQHTFEFSLYPSLTEHLSGWIGAVLIRSLLQQLHIDEHHIFRWRLENKFRQYQVLNYYVPGCMPSTFGLGKLLKETNGTQKIQDLVRKGYFVKATLGHGSGKTKSFDKTDLLDDVLASVPEESSGLESWMLQQKIDIKAELRIHSFEKQIIQGLSFPTGGEQVSDKLQAEGFVEDILQQLPESILNGTLLAWDIAVIKNGQYKVIETNITGYHPEFAAGFQTTGYVDDEVLGPIVCAWINTYLKHFYCLSIAGTDPPELTSQNLFLHAFDFHNKLIRDKAGQLFQSREKRKEGAVLYMELPYQQLLLNFLTFLTTTGYFKKYIILCTNSIYENISKYIGKNKSIQVIACHNLFTESRLQLISQLGDRRRKELCFSYLLKSDVYINDWIFF